MKILHLIDPGSAGGGPCTLRLVAEVVSRPSAHRHDVLIVGTAEHLALARRCGLAPLGCIAAPLNCPALGRTALRRFLRAYGSAHGRYDLLHAWTFPSAVLLALAAPSRRILAGAVIGPTAPVALPLAVGRLNRRAVPMLAASPAVGSEYEAAGLDPRLLSVLVPAVSREMIAFEDRPLLRERWGADETTFVVGLLGEALSRTAAQPAAVAVSRAAIAGRHLKLVLHHGAAGCRSAQQWLASLAERDRFIVDDQVAEPWRILPGLDAALFMQRGCGSFSILPVLWAMAAGVPVIAEAAVAMNDIIDHGRSGLLIPPGDANAVADRILCLYDDSSARDGIAAAGRELIEMRFNPDLFAARLDDVYRQCRAGEPIRIAPDPLSLPQTVGAAVQTDPG